MMWLPFLSQRVLGGTSRLLVPGGHKTGILRGILVPRCKMSTNSSDVHIAIIGAGLGMYRQNYVAFT